MSGSARRSGRGAAPLALLLILGFVALAAAGGAALVIWQSANNRQAVNRLKWVSPQDGDSISGMAPIQIMIPADATVTTFYLDQRPIGVAAQGATSSVRVDTFGVGNGTHVLQATSQTAGGAVFTSPAIRVRVANGSDPVVAAAGDIACSPLDPRYNEGKGTRTACRMLATSHLLDGRNLAAVLALGDTQYMNGDLAGYAQSYAASWGRYKDITSPVPGNHEYLTPGALGYFAYFGVRAGDAAKGYYSFDLGYWHIIALNTQCDQIGGCGAGSREETWLRADLNAHPARCTLAIGHIPRFGSSAENGNDPELTDFWRDLYSAGADLIVAAHNHQYERFAPMDPQGKFDSQRGIREIVAGTGGGEHAPFGKILPNSEARNDNTFGVLLLTLHPDAYSWQFVPEPGGTFTDAGSGTCH